jgi:hypothetical protein
MSGENFVMRSLMIWTAHQLFFGDKIEKNEMGGACSAYGVEERRIQGLVGKSEGKKPLGRPRRRWEDNIKLIFRKWKVGVWTEASWLRIGQMAGICECGNEPSGSIHWGNFLTSCETVIFARKILLHPVRYDKFCALLHIYLMSAIRHCCDLHCDPRAERQHDDTQAVKDT